MLADLEVQALGREVDQIRKAIVSTERLRDEGRAKVAADESAIRSAADHLIESRDRLLRDFTAFHGLIESARTVHAPSLDWHPTTDPSDRLDA